MLVEYEFIGIIVVLFEFELKVYVVLFILVVWNMRLFFLISFIGLLI